VIQHNANYDEVKLINAYFKIWMAYFKDKKKGSIQYVKPAVDLPIWDVNVPSILKTFLDLVEVADLEKLNETLKTISDMLIALIFQAGDKADADKVIVNSTS
jgi:hypothetical protein